MNIKTILIASTTIMLIFTAPHITKHANAVAVSDAGSYARMAQQLSELKRHFDVLQEQLQTVTEMKNAATGNLKRAKGAFRSLDRIRDWIDGLDVTIPNTPALVLKDIDLSKPEDVKQAIKFLYPNKDTTEFEKTQTSGQREAYQQRNIQNSLEGTEYIINSQAERFDLIGELLDEVDETETLKDALDLNNRIMAEVLSVLHQQLLMDAQNIRADKSQQLKYIDDTSTENVNIRKKTTDLDELGKRMRRQTDKYIKDNNLQTPAWF